MVMSEPDEPQPKPTYRWPWYVLAAVVLFVALSILWMSYAVRREEEQRDFNAPLPATAPH